MTIARGLRAPLLLGLAALGPLFCACQPEPAAAPLDGSAPRQGAHHARPRLVLWLTIDQMGANVLERQARHLPGSALGQLLDEGLWFTAAAYSHAITETAPGHATLHTGAPPRVHGIVGNEWLDRTTKTPTISVFDPDASLLGPGVLVDLGPSAGRSPHLLAAPTVGDALSAATHGVGRVVSISIKDRAAILSGGFAGKAYWLGPRGYVTSRYYHETAPAWLTQHQEKHPLDGYFRTPWTLALPQDRYAAHAEPSPFAPASLGRDFPHAPRNADDVREAVKRSPLGDRASLDLARSAIEAIDLGADEVPDLLAVSLSACDYVGHYYGPETLEAEDAFVRLNQELQAFLDFVRKRVPTDRLLIVVSADHGGTERADSLEKAGLPGRRVTTADLSALTRSALLSLSPKLGATLPFYVVSPYVTLDREALEHAGIGWQMAVERVAQALRKGPGIHAAFVTEHLEAVDELSRKVRDSIYPGRSGDIYVVPEPHSLLLQEDELGATHGSPWSYDSRVPIVLHGAGIPQGRVARPVEVTSLAPTVSRWLGIDPPAGASTTVLTEAWSRESLAPTPPR